MITSGELPCSKEEAATLAGIQLRLEEAWPNRDLDLPTADDYESRVAMAAAVVVNVAQNAATTHDGGDRERETLLQPDNACASSSATTPATFSKRPRTATDTTSSSAAVQQAAYAMPSRKTKMTSSRRHGRLTTAKASGGCIDGEDGVRSCFRLPDGAMVKCLPPEYRSSRGVRTLIEVRLCSTLD